MAVTLTLDHVVVLGEGVDVYDDGEYKTLLGQMYADALGISTSLVEVTQATWLTALSQSLEASSSP